MNQLDPTKHRNVSLLKSLTRIIGYAVLPLTLEHGIVLLIVAEIIGIIEELV